MTVSHLVDQLCRQTLGAAVHALDGIRSLPNLAGGESLGSSQQSRRVDKRHGAGDEVQRGAAGFSRAGQPGDMMDGGPGERGDRPGEERNGTDSDQLPQLRDSLSVEVHGS
jgi:hypothetical protein